MKNSVVSAPDQILFRRWSQKWGGWHTWYVWWRGEEHTGF